MTAVRIHGGPDGLGVPQHDFSTNANACGACPRALMDVISADTAHYPEPAYAALRERLAAFHRVAPQRIALAASGSEFIFRVTAWAARQGARRVWLPPHAYGDYAQAARAWGLERAGDPREAQLAWACEPASPLGGAEPEAERLMARGGTLVLDRAYEPLRLSGAPSFDAAALARLWQLYSPNKALGLTGVRAAYAIAPEGAEDTVAELDALAPSWLLGAHGVAMLLAWTQPAAQTWLQSCLPKLRDWKAQQLALCASLGWEWRPSEANFFCARPATSDLPALLARLRGAGIKLRDAASFGLPGSVRLAVLGPGAQNALLRAAAV